jgi:hypothetical protein
MIKFEQNFTYKQKELTILVENPKRKTFKAKKRVNRQKNSIFQKGLGIFHYFELSLSSIELTRYAKSQVKYLTSTLWIKKFNIWPELTGQLKSSRATIVKSITSIKKKHTNFFVPPSRFYWSYLRYCSTTKPESLNWIE